MAVLRKAKQKLKKVKKVIGKKKKQTQTVKEEKKHLIASEEILVSTAKFYTPPSPQTKPNRLMPQDLPFFYGEDKIVLQVRDPWWLHTYWEVTPSTWDKLKARLGEDFYRAKKILRVYDVSQIIFNGNNAHRFFDIEATLEASNWYIDTGGPGRSWCVDLGLRLANGKFIMIVRSNTVHTPLDGPSWITDEEWMIPDDLFARLYGMGVGLGRSSPVGKAWRERIKAGLWSSGMASMASPTKLQKQRKFWFVLDCELIVYGATEPDAKVMFQGKEIKLRRDGTFTFRFSLPDGEQVMPVKAVSADGLEEIIITPIVNRATKRNSLVKEKV